MTLNTLDIEAASRKVKENLEEVITLTEGFITYYLKHLEQPSLRELNRLGLRVRHAYKTLDIILRCSLIERERVKRKIDLKKLLKEVINFLQPLSNVEIKIDGDLPVVMADKIRMHQLFLNIISNSIDAMDKPLGAILITSTIRRRRCYICIEDNGRGIGLRYQRNLFRLFHITPESRQAGRTGVGLVIVKKIVEEGRGTVTLTSVKGKGTKVVFDIPL